MKKILFIGLCCLCLCGCGNNRYEISQMNWSGYSNWITGTIKNNSSKSCNTLWINLEFQNGALKEDDLCIVYNLSAKETKDFECIYSGDIKDIKSYAINLKSIKCKD